MHSCAKCKKHPVWRNDAASHITAQHEFFIETQLRVVIQDLGFDQTQLQTFSLYGEAIDRCIKRHKKIDGLKQLVRAAQKG